MVSSEFANCEDDLNISTVSSGSSSRRQPVEKQEEMYFMEFDQSSLDENMANEVIHEEECIQNLSSFDSQIITKEDATAL